MNFPTGTVTLVFTDVQGSTALWEKLQDRFSPVLAEHNRIMRSAIKECDGYEVKTEGDSFMVAFPRADLAVRFALTAQQSLTNIKLPDDGGELLVRIGCHTGEPICELDPTTGRMDYFGPFVNRAARVGAAGHGGQTLISNATHDQAADVLRESGALVTDLGEHRLKGLSKAEHIYQVLPPGLAARVFPKLKTLDEVPTNLPFQTTVFVGREREWNAISELLKQDRTSLVTLTGPGGIGKTRLSLRVGSELLEHFPGGVWFADLTEAWSSEAVAAAVAAAFDAPITGGESAEKVVASVLEMRKPLLLILDNFEQVVKFASTTVGQWMQRARHVKFLITSRSLLGLSGEREFRLEPLPTPPRRGAATKGAAVRLSSFDVVRLFVERAREAKPGFDLTDENADDIAEICASLEGMPLAIELAAARVRIMNPAQMVQKLSQKFQLLRSSRRDLPGRQQSLAGAIDWSYDLLSETERSALCQACVFHGGFFLEAAESVIDLSDQPDAPFAMDVIDALRSHSLLATVDTEYGPRFRMYNAIREYAEIKLIERMDDLTRDALERRHADHYLSYAEEWDARRAGKDAVEALDRLEMELENLFYAQDFTERTKDAVGSARAILGLAVMMALRGVSAQRISRLERAMAMLELYAPTELALRGRVLASLCLACQDIGDWNRAAKLADEGVTLAERVGEASQIGSALINRAEMLRLRGATEEALDCFTRAEQVFESIGDKGGVGRAVGGIGSVLWKKGEYDEATARFVQAAEIFEKLGNQAGIARNVGGQGIVYAERHDFDAALQCYEQAESMHRLMGNRAAIARTIGNKAIALQEKGDLDAALKCFAEAESINRELGHKPSVARNIGSRGLVLDEQKQYDEALKCFTDAETIHRELGNRSGIASNLARRGATMVTQNHCAEAVTPLTEARELFDSIGEGSTRQAFDCLAVLALALRETGDVEGARAAATSAGAIASALGIDAAAPDEKTRRALAVISELTSAPQ